VHLRKYSIGLILILLSLSTVFNYAIAVAVTPPTIQASVEDLNGDGLKDIKFTAMKEGLGFSGVHINVSIGISSGLTLFAGETDNNGSCLFFDVPGGTYEWVASIGVPNSGEITIPTSEFCLTESEAVAWQTIALSWIGESQDAGRALFEEMSRFVGFDSTDNPFSSLVGSTLLEYSQKTYQWLDQLQTYIVGLDRPELNLLNKIILPFKAVSLGFLEDTANGIDFSEITRIQMQLVLNASERSMTYAFANQYSDGSTAGYHEIAKLLLSFGFEKTAWSALQPVLSALEHYNKPSFIDPSATWDSSVRSSDGSLANRMIGVFNMSKSTLSRALDFLNQARSVLDPLAKSGNMAEKLLETISTLTTAVYIAIGIIVTVIFILHWWDKYQTLGSFFFNLFQADPVLLVEVAMVAFNVAVCLFYLLIAPTIAIPGIGILFAIVEAILWVFYDRANYADYIKDIEKQASIEVTKLFKIRQSLRNIGVPTIKDSARTYGKAASLIAQFAEVAHQYSVSPDIEESFAESSGNINAYAEQQLELANAVGNATLSLDNLLSDYLSWNGDNEQVRAHLEGYNSTIVTYQHGWDNFQNAAVVGTDNGSSYKYQKKIVQAGDLEGTISFTPERDVAVYSWPSWSGWAFDEPTENDTKGNPPFAVFYNVGAQPFPFEYKPKPDYMNYGYLSAMRTVSGDLFTFFEYKFHFDDGTTRYGFWEYPLRYNMWKQETLVHWLAQIAQDTNRFRVDLKRVQIALNAPVYEENATSKPQTGNSWLKVTDSSSMSGQVMMASTYSTNGGCLFGPYITLTSSGESMSGNPYLAIFKLKVSSNASSSVVASIDVAYNSGSILQSMQIKAGDFRSSGTWQDFSLPFTVPVSMTAGLEFRVRNSNNGVADLFFDKISITRRWNSSTLYYEAAYNKLRSKNGPWSVLNDPTSLSGLVMMTSRFSQNNGWLYGPYINENSGNSLRGKACVATFRLKVSSNQYSNTVARIDIGYNAGSVLQWMQIKANDFASANNWQDFKLTFVVPNSLTAGLEFRVQNLNSGIADLSVDTITVVPWGNSSVVFAESAFNKQQLQSDISWHNESDSSSFSGLVMKASASVQNGYWLYGPYITSDQSGQSLCGKPYVAIFRSKVSFNLSPNTVAYIDIAYDAGSVLQSLSIKASDFAYSNVWQDFRLAFVVPNGLTYGLEFRVQNLNNGVTDLYVDTIIVCQGWNYSDAYVEAAYNKMRTGSWQIWPSLFDSSWSRVQDSSSFSGLVMKAASSSQRSDCLYGPYITSDWNGQSMLGKPYTATFRLKVSSNTSASGIIHIDIGYNAGQTLQSMLIKANDFTSANTWQDFKLTFIAPSSLTYGLEFRIISLNTGVTDVYADKITVDPEWNASTTYLESAYNKFQSGNSWSKASDSSSFSGAVMKASVNSPNGGCLFGPYIYAGWDQESMIGRAYTATFRLKVSSNLAASDVVSIDVACNAGTVLQSLRIKATDFVSSNAWQDFKLTFVVPSSLTYGLEFRITNLNHGTTDIFADYISINQT
jgi:hypothetical protein